MFENRIASKLNRMVTKRRKRELRLDQLALDTDRIRDEREAAQQDILKLRSELEAMNEVEVKDDEDIAATAMQIRATISKVGSSPISILFHKPL